MLAITEVKVGDLERSSGYDEDHPAECAIAHLRSERLREEQGRLNVDRLNAAPGIGFDLLKRLELERRRCVNEDVASAVAIEDELGCLVQRRPDCSGRPRNPRRGSRTTTVWSGASRSTIAPPMALAPPVTTATR